MIGQTQNAHNSQFSSINSGSLESISIDGKTIPLTNSGNVGALFTKIQTTDNTTGQITQTTASGSQFSYIRFGSTLFVNGMTGEQKSYDFVLGDITPTSGSHAVPTSGTATYSGLSLISNIGGGAWSQGTSRFDVDFGRKTINGIVSTSPYTLNLSGNIDGASFNGDKDGISMKGNFYGPNAAELGGVFKGSAIEGDITNFTGSFGAKKQ